MALLNTALGAGGGGILASAIYAEETKVWPPVEPVPEQESIWDFAVDRMGWTKYDSLPATWDPSGALVIEQKVVPGGDGYGLESPNLTRVATDYDEPDRRYTCTGTIVVDSLSGGSVRLNLGIYCDVWNNSAYHFQEISAPGTYLLEAGPLSQSSAPGLYPMFVHVNLDLADNGTVFTARLTDCQIVDQFGIPVRGVWSVSK